jgi:hypothetical protein
MVDAGNASLEHANLIHDADYGYIFAIKQPPGDIHDEAVRLLGGLPAEQAESARMTQEKGARVTVRLWRVSIRGYLRWSHARQLIRVERTVEKGQQVSTGVRYFVTNLVPGRLSAKLDASAPPW